MAFVTHEQTISKFAKVSKDATEKLLWAVSQGGISSLDTMKAVEAGYISQGLALNNLSPKVYAYIASLGVASAAELSFAQKLKLSTMMMWENTQAFLASPIGILTSLVAITWAAVAAFDTRSATYNFESISGVVTKSGVVFATNTTAILKNNTDEYTPTLDYEPATKKYVDDAVANFDVPQATSTALGGVKADPSTEEDTQPVHIGEDGKLYTAPGGTGGAADAVQYVEQTLTEDQQMQARANLGLYRTEIAPRELAMEIMTYIPSGGSSSGLNDQLPDDMPSAIRAVIDAVHPDVNCLDVELERRFYEHKWSGFWYEIYGNYDFIIDVIAQAQDNPASADDVYPDVPFALYQYDIGEGNSGWLFTYDISKFPAAVGYNVQVYDPADPVVVRHSVPDEYLPSVVKTINGEAPDENGNVEITIPDSSQNVNAVEPAEDDIPKVFFGGALQQTKDEAVVPFRYISKTEDISGYAEIKAQGNSSMNYAKKNQTVKMFKDAACEEKLKVDFKGWGKQNKHVYKANWIDLSHARNVVSARLWADVVKSRANYAELPELLRTTPNQGAVDGFPVKVYAAGVYQGRYTLNIPKDKWTFNMDDELDEHCVLYSENYVSGCFRAAANINGSDWTDEIHDTVPASIKTRWNEVISFVMNSTDEEFNANLSQYFYVDSLLDYYLFGLASCGLDAFGKNQIYATYDGQRWIASVYDMDATWGLYWNGSKFVATDYARTSYEDFVNTNGNLLYIRLEQLFYEELQARWAELKNGALSIENVINRFERFTDIAPSDLVKEDYAGTTGGGNFTGIPLQTGNHIQQLRYFALARLAWTDEYVEGLTPVVAVPCEGITLDKATLTFDGSGTQTLTATVTPDGCTDAVTWESDATDIATVNNGVVTAVANGSAVITAKCGTHSANCNVTVEGIEEGDEPSGGDLTGEAVASDALLFDLDATKFTADALVLNDNTGNAITTLYSADCIVENGVVQPGERTLGLVQCTWNNAPVLNAEMAFELFCLGLPQHAFDGMSHKMFIGTHAQAGDVIGTGSVSGGLKSEAPFIDTSGATGKPSGTTSDKIVLDDGTAVSSNNDGVPGYNGDKYMHIVFNYHSDGTIVAYVNGYPCDANPTTTDFASWDFSSILSGFYVFHGNGTSLMAQQVLKSARMYNRCLTKDEIRNNLAFEAKKMGL